MKRFLFTCKIALIIIMGAFLLCENDLTTYASAADDETDVVKVESPRVSKQTGAYDEEFDLTITVPEGCSVYYTLDGSNPIRSNTRITYTDPITITDRKGDKNYVSAVDPALFDCAYGIYDKKTKGMTDKYSAPDDDKVDKATVVRAVAVDSSGNYSSVVTNTYFIGSMADHIKGIKESAKAAGIPLSIMSISVDYDDLFDYEKGIYVKGKIFDEAFADVSTADKRKNIVDATRKLPANYNQKGKEWEREAHIDYIESNGTTTNLKLAQDCGIRIQGNYSRSDLQKSFRLYARKDYGNKNFEYPFFGNNAKDKDGKQLKKFKKLVLRNGGNDAFITKYRDTFWQSLLTELKNDTLASRACVVYLDGEYWGLYILQEDYGDDYAEDHHGVTKDNVVTYKGDAEKYPEIGYEMDDGTLPEGIEDYTYYMKELNNFFYTHTKCISTEDYNDLAAIIDPESLMEYFAVEIWINNKWDWPGKNWYIWKTTEELKEDNIYTDGRFRFTYCDLDFGGWSGSSEAYTNTIQNDGYKPNGLLDFNTTNPVAKAFAYFMTNESFRTDFKAMLKSLGSSVFEYSKVAEKAKLFDAIYSPLYEQFYERYVSKNVDGEDDSSDFLKGASEVYGNIIGFASARVNAIDNMNNYVDTIAKTYADIPEPSYEPTADPYKTPESSKEPVPTVSQEPVPVESLVPSPSAATPTETVTPSNEPDTSAKPQSSPESSPKADTNTTKKPTLKVTVKKNKKKVIIKSNKKAKLTIKFSAKVPYKNGKKVKKVKKITVAAKKNKKGKITLSFSKKLKKKLKITVTTVYKGKKRTVKVTVK